MTKEYAIKLLKLAKAELEWDYPLDYQIALDMAIKALEQELCESSIQPKLSVDRVCDILVEMFETPCDYRFNDIDIDDFMCDDDYCEHHCSYVGKGECWKRFFEKYDKFSKESD